jgi:hypothetical protein
MNMDDLNIYYIGGSGGFYLMHQLLMTGKYWCSFGEKFNHLTIDEVRTYTFNTDRKSWKDNEIWPKNAETAAHTTELRKLYLFNNMWGFSDWEKYNGIKLALSMDERSWLRMTSAKGAALYWNKPIQKYFSITRNALRENAYKRYISSSKEQAGSWCYDWKDIITPTGLKQLFDRLGLEMTDRNMLFMKEYLKQHDMSLLKRIMGSSFNELNDFINT